MINKEIIDAKTGEVTHIYDPLLDLVIEPETITIDYDTEVVSRIRLRYDINRELKVQRERDSNTEQFNEYYNYVEQCKIEVREMCDL